MEIKCKDKIIKLNPILEHSQTIFDIKDCLEDGQIIELPAEFLDILETIPPDFNIVKSHIEVYKTLHTNQQYLLDTNILNLYQTTIAEILKRRLLMLKLYNYLNVDEQEISNLSYEIGYILYYFQIENIDIESNLLTIILIHYPDLQTDPKYSNIWIPK